MAERPGTAGGRKWWQSSLLKMTVMWRIPWRAPHSGRVPELVEIQMT